MEGSFNSEGGGPYGGGMEARVARLETGVSEIKLALARLEPVLGQVSKDLADFRSDIKDLRSEMKDVKSEIADLRQKDLVELKVAAAKLEGRVSQLPSTVQLLGFVLAVLAIAGVTRFITGP